MSKKYLQRFRHDHFLEKKKESEEKNRVNSLRLSSEELLFSLHENSSPHDDGSEEKKISNNRL